MHTATLRVRGYECDPYGHVNNAVYLNYLETARDQLLTDLGLDYRALLDAGGGIWVAEAHLKYVSPAVHQEELTIQTVQEELGAVSGVLKQTIIGPDGRTVVEARMKLVWVSGGKPSRVPADWRTKFNETLVP
jgi:acyl-CoA thioester hydrolase